jgi:hypothetical protein
MRFTWTGLILAPLLVPMMFSAAFLSSFAPSALHQPDPMR